MVNSIIMATAINASEGLKVNYQLLPNKALVVKRELVLENNKVISHVKEMVPGLEATPDIAMLKVIDNSYKVMGIYFDKNSVDLMFKISDYTLQAWELGSGIILVVAVISSGIILGPAGMALAAASAKKLVSTIVIKRGKQFIKAGVGKNKEQIQRGMSNMIKNTRGTLKSNKNMPLNLSKLKTSNQRKEAQLRVLTLKKGDGPNNLLRDYKISELPKAKRNASLANQKHQVTGVKYNSGAYPKFKADHSFNMGYTNKMNWVMRKTMSQTDIRKEHTRLAWEDLFEFSRNNKKAMAKLGLKGNEGKRILRLLQKGKIPKNSRRNAKGNYDPIWSPHHNERNGNLMEMVKFKDHALSGHDGGMTRAWGSIP